MEKKNKIWVFRNHLGELRYVISDKPPVKTFVYGCKLSRTEEKPKYHGSSTITVEYYKPDFSVRNYYYDYCEAEHNIDEHKETVSRERFVPKIYGDIIPDEIVTEELKSLIFADGPVSFELQNEKLATKHDYEDFY